MIINIWMTRASPGLHRSKKKDGDGLIASILLINICLNCIKAILQFSPAFPVRHGAVEQGDLSGRIFRFYQFHEFNVVTNKSSAVKGEPFAPAVAVAKVISSQCDAYNVGFVRCKIPQTVTVELKIILFIHLRHGGSIAVPVPVNPDATYGAKNKIGV
jgi:hypothetical protein